eukprot:1218776-Pleurochrysis_carterae.AAC.1
MHELERRVPVVRRLATIMYTCSLYVRTRASGARLFRVARQRSGGHETCACACVQVARPSHA